MTEEEEEGGRGCGRGVETGGGREAGAGGSGQGVGEGRRQVRGAGQGLAAEKVKEGGRPGRPVRKIEGGGRPVKRGGGLLVRRGGSLPVRGGGLQVRRTNLNIPEVKKADMQYRTGGPGQGAVRGRGWCVLIQIGRRTLLDLRLMHYYGTRGTDNLRHKWTRSRYNLILDGEIIRKCVFGLHVQNVKSLVIVSTITLLYLYTVAESCGYF